jgi:site-specific recombinase XerD
MISTGRMQGKRYVKEQKKKDMNTLPANYIDLVEKYRLYVVGNGGRKGTWGITYVRQFLQHLYNENMSVEQVCLEDAERYQGQLLVKKDEQGSPVYCSRTVISIIGCVSVFYDYLVKQGATLYNPFKGIERIKSSRSLPRNILDEEKLSELLDSLKEKIRTGKNLDEKRRFYRIHVLAELMYSTGARINEVVKLTEEDLDLMRGVVTLRDDKTGMERTGFLNSYVCELLHLYIDTKPLITGAASNEELLFNSKARLCRNFNRDIRAVSETLELGNFKSHNLRHSFGSHMLRAGCDIRYIQAFLGHTRLSTTQIYTKIDKLDLRSVLDTFHPRKLHHEEL